MSKIEIRGSQARDSSDWNRAWSVVSQLAAARGTTLRELDEDKSTAVPGAPIDPQTGPAPAENFERAFAPIAPDQLTRDIAEIEQAAATLQWAEPQPRPAIAPDQLAQDMAEIEQAAAALRRAEPTLERRATEMMPATEAPASRSVWPLVCVIWLTALLVVSSTIGAIVLLVR
ncbi:MAG TPA: hypothetical protein VGN55_07640 [Xanthobacteraceae bacterium]